MCMFARVGGEQGARISRAAFSVILKFTDKVEMFKRLHEEIDTESEGVTSSGTQKLKDIISLLKENQSEDY